MCSTCDHNQPICGAEPKGARPPCILPKGHPGDMHENVHGEQFGSDEIVHPETLTEYAHRTTVTELRPLWAIAEDIRSHWVKPYFGAVPYLDAMSELNEISGAYYQDSAKSIVRYFLANARNWRGPDAQRIKKELKGML